MSQSRQTVQSIHFTPLSEHLGARVHGIDLSKPVNKVDYRQIDQALVAHSLLLFRDQDIAPQQLVTFSRKFGELHIHVLEQYQVPGSPEIFVISNVVENGRHIGAYGGALHFHSDLSYDPEPSMGSLFHCRETPPEGGQTEFASMFAAYDALPEKLRQGNYIRE